MPTIDSLLPIIANNIKAIQHVIPKKDKRILLSLAKQLTFGVFLTENQGNLLVKIINENILSMTTIVPDVKNTLEEKMWSKTFREVKKIKKIHTSPEFPNCFIVEFSYNNKFREKISQLNTSLRGNIISQGSKYIIQLTEENLLLVVNAFKNDGFEIDEKITKFFEEIQEIQKNTNDPFNIFDLKNEKLKSAIEADLGAEFLQDLRLLQDRKFRYQYKNDQKIPEFSLEDKIANRPNRKVFVNATATTFTEVMVALKNLNRFPAMIVFDGHQSSKDKKFLKILENAVNDLSLGDDIGIYFRYNKEQDSDKFNQEIASLGYNKNLGDTTVIAGISNNKIPKFMIKNQWKPKTVVSFTSSFKSNKSYVYCSDIDLVIYYSSSQPLDKEVHVLV